MAWLGVQRTEVAIPLQPISRPAREAQLKEPLVLLHRWKWIQEGCPTLDIFLVRRGQVLACHVDHGTNRTECRLFEQSSPEVEADLKTCEPIFEQNGSVTFVKPAIEWLLPQDVKVRIRGLVGPSQMFWQIVKPDHIEYLSLGKTQASATCSPASKDLIEGLYNRPVAEVSSLLPFFELADVRNGKEIVLQPIPLRSYFDFEVKTTAFHWGITLISYKGQLRICFEGIQDDHFFSVWFSHLNLPKKGPFRLSYQSLAPQPFTLFTQLHFESRSAIQLIKSEEVKELLKSLTLRNPQLPSSFQALTGWNPFNLNDALIHTTTEQ